MSKPLIVLGAGGHAKVVMEILRLSGRTVIGLIDPGKPAGSTCLGTTVLGDNDVIHNYSPGEVELINGLGAMPGNSLRWEISQQMKQQGFRFATIQHPSAIIADNVQLAAGVQLMAGTIIQPGVKIGEDSIINTGVHIDHDCNIGACCHLAPGVVLSGGVILGTKVHVGTGTSVIQNIEIGQGSIIAAGSIVYKDIPHGVKYIQSRTEQFKSIGGH